MHPSPSARLEAVRIRVNYKKTLVKSYATNYYYF
jgi:hypothetical protein